MEDRRHYPRLGEIWDVAYRPIDSEEQKDELLRGNTVDISSGGVQFEADDEIAEGTILALELETTVFPSSIIAVGKVVWCSKQEKKDKYAVGVEFQWMGWEDLDVQQALTEYITSQP
ncbi:PilZ domain-containing protein [Gemmatimonadota bacterium]